GFVFAQNMMRGSGLGPGDVAQAYIAARDAFNLRELWAAIEGLDGVTAALQSQLFTSVNRFIEHCCRWFMQHVPRSLTIADVMARYAKGIKTVEDNADAHMTDT